MNKNPNNQMIQDLLTNSEQLLAKINQLFLEKKYDEELDLINKGLEIYKAKTNTKYTCYNGTDSLYFNDYLKIKSKNLSIIEYNLLIIKCNTYILLKDVGEAEKVIKELDKKVPNAAQVYSLKANVVKLINRYIKLDDILNEQYNYIYDSNLFAEFLKNKGIFYMCFKKDYPTAINYFSASLKYNNGKDAIEEINAYINVMKKSFNFNGQIKNYQDAINELQNKNLIAQPAERNVEFSKYLYKYVLSTIKDNKNYVKLIRENCVKMAGEEATKEIEKNLGNK